jgi:hypothetical protein
MPNAEGQLVSRATRALRVLVFWLAAAVLGAALGLGGYFVWFRLLRGQPAPLEVELFEGVRYERRVRARPVAVVEHLVRVRLAAPGVALFVTPPDRTRGRMLRAQTPGYFLARHRLQLAINGDFFIPFRATSPWNYYPHAGDPVDVFGFAASAGRVYSRGSPGRPTLYISCRGGASFRRPLDVCHAISGLSLVRDGRLRLSRPQGPWREPRTALGLDRREEWLLLLVVDGRQHHYSQGATVDEAAATLIGAGAHEAINLDGGGSSTLVVERDGRPFVLSSPMHTRIPGRERPVANHLGVRARPRAAR